MATGDIAMIAKSTTNNITINATRAAAHRRHAEESWSSTHRGCARP